MLQTVIILNLLVFFHWIADFVMQSPYMANQKSSSNSALFAHVFTYSTVITLLLLFLGGLVKLTFLGFLAFWVITLISHFITDYITSRIVKKRFAKGNYGIPIPNTGAFTVIGFDQFLHYTQLFLTFALLFL